MTKKNKKIAEFPLVGTINVADAAEHTAVEPVEPVEPAEAAEAAVETAEETVMNRKNIIRTQDFTDEQQRALDSFIDQAMAKNGTFMNRKNEIRFEDFTHEQQRALDSFIAQAATKNETPEMPAYDSLLNEAVAEHAEAEADEHAAVEPVEPSEAAEAAVMPASIEELFALPPETIIKVSANEILTLFGHEIIAIKKQITAARPPHTLNKLDCPASIEDLQQFLVGNRPEMQGYIEINEILSLIVSELVEEADKRAARNCLHYYRCNC